MEAAVQQKEQQQLDIGKLFTKSNYARHINKTPTWVTKLIQAGKLKEVNVNGKIMVTEIVA